MEQMQGQGQGQEQDILRQLGIELPNVAGMPTNPSANPQMPLPSPVGVMELAKTLIVGAIMSLEGALQIYGYTSDEGKSIAKAIDVLENVIPENELQQLKAQMGMLMGGMGGGMTGSSGGLTSGSGGLGGLTSGLTGGSGGLTGGLTSGSGGIVGL